MQNRFLSRGVNRVFVTRPSSYSVRALSAKTPKETILAASLNHVQTYGWTEEAIAQGVISSGLPPSYIGRVEHKQSDLIHYFMKTSNDNLKKIIQESNELLKGMTHTQVISFVIRKRLEMNIPFIEQKRWHEGMALGAMPYNALETAQHLEQLITIIEDALKVSDRLNIAAPLGLLEKGALGGVYFTTELHLLTDSSQDYGDTWTFLDARVKDLETAAEMGVNGGIPLPMNKDQIIAATSVATSMAGAVLSVLAPALTTGVQSVASSVFPHVSNIVMKNDLMNNHNTQSKRSSKDFEVDMDDLPPFKTVSNDAGGSKG